MSSTSHAPRSAYMSTAFRCGPEPKCATSLAMGHSAAPTHGMRLLRQMSRALWLLSTTHQSSGETICKQNDRGKCHPASRLHQVSRHQRNRHSLFVDMAYITSSPARYADFVTSVPECLRWPSLACCQRRNGCKNQFRRLPRHQNADAIAKAVAFGETAGVQEGNAAQSSPMPVFADLGFHRPASVSRQPMLVDVATRCGKGRRSSSTGRHPHQQNPLRPPPSLRSAPASASGPSPDHPRRCSEDTIHYLD